MNRRDMLRTTGAAACGLGLGSFPLGWVAGATPAPKRMLMFTKSAGFEHSAIKRDGDKLSHAERILTELANKHGFEVTATKDGGVFTPEQISRYDAFFFYTTGDLTTPGTDKTSPMSAKGKQALLAAIRNGKGFIGTHSATDTFHSPGDRYDPRPPAKLDPYIEMIGAEFIRHGRQQKARMRVADPRFPGVSELGDGFELHEEWYALRSFQPNLHVVLINETEGMVDAVYQRPPFPATWARMHGKGRVFYTSMGHREDVWENAQFQAVLLGGVAWALGHIDADITPNIDKTTPKANDIPPAALERPAAKKKA